MSNTTCVLTFTHLKDQYNADKALHLLQRVASLVKPIMRKRGWVLPVLSEFYPEKEDLYGLNVNKGQKILLRLRPPNSKDLLLPEHQVIQVMLHELTHNVYSDHDDSFYRYLDDLKLEYKGLEWSSWDGEGFLSIGHLLGIEDFSTHVPPQVGRLKGLEAAENRAKAARAAASAGPIGAPNRKTVFETRESAARAAEKRLRDSKACASGVEAEREVQKAAEQSVTFKPTEKIVSGRDSGPIKVDPSQSLSAGLSTNPQSALRPGPNTLKSRLLTGNLGLAEQVKIRQNPPLKKSPPASSKANRSVGKGVSAVKETAKQAAEQSLPSIQACASGEEAQDEAQNVAVEDVACKPQNENISPQIKDFPSQSHLTGSSRNLQSELRSVPKTFRSRLLTGNFGRAEQVKIEQNSTISPPLKKTPPASSEANRSVGEAVPEANESAEQTTEQSLPNAKACASSGEVQKAAAKNITRKSLDESNSPHTFGQVKNPPSQSRLVSSSGNSRNRLRPVSKALRSRLLTENLGPAEQEKNRHKSTISSTLEKSVQVSSKTKNEWACSKCTTLNSAKALQCDACRRMRKGQNEHEGWSCLLCGEPGNIPEHWSCRFCGWIKVQS